MIERIFKCACKIQSYFDEHLALGARFDRGAIDRHGLPVSRELQGELLLHQLSDHLMDDNGGIYDRGEVEK